MQTQKLKYREKSNPKCTGSDAKVQKDNPRPLSQEMIPLPQLGGNQNIRQLDNSHTTRRAENLQGIYNC